MSTRQRIGPRFVQDPLPGPDLIASTAYTNPVRFQDEVELVFLKTWLRTFRASDVADAGDYVVWDRMKQSVIVVRQEDGSLGAFHNVCQHRGARLCADSGHSNGRFVCPWHGFTYDLTGKAVHIPLADRFAPGLLDNLCIPEIAVEEWAGWVWINFLGDKAEPFDGFLGELKEELDYYRMDDWKVWGHRIWEVPSNWKTILEAFQEAWHVPFAHRKSLPGSKLDQGVTFHQLGDRHSLMVMTSEADQNNIDPDADHREVAFPHYTAFPNSVFSCNLRVNRAHIAWPVAPNEALYEFYIIAPESPPNGSISQEAYEDQMRRSWDRFQVIIGEDVEVATGAGSVANSLGYEANRLNTEEYRISATHAALERQIAEMKLRSNR